MLKIGDRVKLIKNIWEPATGESPGGRLGKIGDEVMIKEIYPHSIFPYHVAHDWVTDGACFGVSDTEITKKTE